MYRPNKSSLRQAGGDTVWMQQQQILEKEKDKEEPRHQLILDLIKDIKNSQAFQHIEIIIMGDFNEDPGDNEDNGIHMLMQTCGLLNVCEELYETLPSTRNNDRAIDHILATPGVFPTIRSAGLVQKEVGFSTSDHQALYIDLDPKVLDTKNIPLQPTSQRKLRTHNAPLVEWYIIKVLERADSHNITTRLKQLQQDIKEFGFTEENRDKLENIDQAMTKIMLTTEQELSPDTKPFPFSVLMLEQINSIRLIKRLRNLKREEKIIEMSSFPEIQD